jgi:uncharacterized protein (TIGR01777 family)
VSGLPAGARAVWWDAASADGWWEEADGARAIVNLAGENLASWPWTEERKRRILESRLKSTRAVVAALERVREGGGALPEVLLQGSGIDYYGPRGDEEVNDDDPPGDDFLARVVVAWEAASAPAEALGVRRVLLRTAMVLARGGGALPKLALPFKLFAGGPIGSGRQWVPWIHLRDEVRAIRFLLERREAAGPFNLAAPEPVRNRELARAVGRALHRPSVFPAPAFAVRAILGEMADVLLHGRRAVPARLRELGFEWEYPGLQRALEGLLA